MVETLGLVIAMRKLLFVILVSVLLLSTCLVRSEGILNAKAFADIYQGDLILNDNNVTIIEGYFEINGSIFIEENATLILRNAVINFTLVGSGINMQNPANGNPRLQAEDIEIVGLTQNRFYGNGSVIFSNLTTDSYFNFEGETNVTVINSNIGGLQAREFVTAAISNSTLQGLSIVLTNGNASVVGLSPGFFGYWDFWANCSVVFKPQTQAPIVTLSQTTVNRWDLSFQGTSMATVTNCTLFWLHTNTPEFQPGRFYVYDSVISHTVEAYMSTTITLTNTTYTYLQAYQDSKIDVYWYLDAHVLDDSPTPGQSVPSANVTASFSNGTFARQALTGVDGWTRLTLMEKMTNATDDYPAGTYTVNATYLSYSSGAIVNMTGNQAITLTLEGFVIPEFPSFLVLFLFLMATLLTVIACKRKRYHTV